MLDNVIDINFYTIPEARRSNLRHRPVGLGLMGFQDALQTLRLPYASDGAVRFADESMEAISFHAISASGDLAAERGRYPSFEGSLWTKGILPIDSIELLAEARGALDLDRSQTLDWESLRAAREDQSACAIPTPWRSRRRRRSPISAASAQSIEPAYQNLFVKSNMSGDFTVVNAALVHDLKARGLWDEVMVIDLKYFDGSRRPASTACRTISRRSMPPRSRSTAAWLVEAAARRQKWIDQSQSLNLYIANPPAGSSTRSIGWRGSAA